jgi:hypothetical protein
MVKSYKLIWIPFSPFRRIRSMSRCFTYKWILVDDYGRSHVPLRVKRTPAAVLLASAVVCAAIGTASAQAPAGPPFRVDSERRSGLDLTGVTLAHGVATLFWFSAPLGSQSEGPERLLLRSFAAGHPINREQVLARDAHSLFSGSTLAGNGSGEIVAVWSHPPRPALNDTVFARRLGGPTGPRGFRVNSSTGNLNTGESAAMDATGRFVVGWTLRRDDGSSQSLAQSFTAAGERLGPEIRLNEPLPTSDIQRSVSLATIPAGFVAVWVSPDSSGTGIYSRRFSLAGEPLGPETQVNEVTFDDQAFPAVASDAAGNFTVVWQSAGQDGSLSAIYGQRFAADGTRIGDEVRLSDPGVTTDEFPVVAGNAQGDFVVAWDDQVHTWFRLVCHDGTSQLARVSSSPAQQFPKVAFDRDAFVVAWNEEEATTPSSHVWARLFSATLCQAP